eukprot:m51a1_g5438 hypothetical protein (504) ;mRNA; r:174123-176114
MAEQQQDQQQQQQQQQDPVYVDISASQGVTEIESLCMACRQMGTTRLLLTRVPHFREIILMAFSCPHCNYQSNEVQSGATIQKHGVRYTLKVSRPEDLNRQIVKGDAASIVIPHLEFEIPPTTQKGSLNTLEGFLSQAASGLGELQQERRAENPEVADKIDSVIAALQKCATFEGGEFTVIVDDPAGNSFVENPQAPAEDPSLSVLHYRRTREQNHALALYDDEEIHEGEQERQQQQEAADEKRAIQEDESYTRLVPSHKNPANVIKGLPETHNRATVTQEQEVVTLEEQCPMCSAMGKMRSVLTKIPHFKEVVIMAFTCDKCGYKTNTVQGGGSVPDHGTRLTLNVKEPLDLTRSFLKSDTASLSIPELHLELGAGTLGSRFTSVEGVLEMTSQELKRNTFLVGDSADSSNAEKMHALTSRLQTLRAGNEPFTLIVDDPMSNSYIQNPRAPEDDPQLIVEKYQRTWQQNEELGLNDIRTELDPVTGEYVAAEPPSLPRGNSS